VLSPAPAQPSKALARPGTAWHWHSVGNAKQSIGVVLLGWATALHSKVTAEFGWARRSVGTAKRGNGSVMATLGRARHWQSKMLK